MTLVSTLITELMEKTSVMIPRIEAPEHRPLWQQLLSQGIRSSDELLALLEIDPNELEFMPVAGDFPLRVPRGFVKRMARGDSHDPLLLQVLPTAAEAAQSPGYHYDPLGEQRAMPVPGLLHKYRGRALLTVTGACAIHCRYCFRRHFPYGDANPAFGNMQESLSYLKQHTDIHEIILSGGDPLMLSDARLQSMTEQLAGIPQLQTLRVHTRLPIVLPERVDQGLLEWLGRQSLQIVIVVHCNHPNEIDMSVKTALQRLRNAGVTLLNQSVLLHGINDDAATLTRLSEYLFAAGVLPYYLHLLDKVQGAAHFAVDPKTAKEIHKKMSAALPGYLVPRLVRDIPGQPGKTPL
jgi:EF-P beta-lysylation protein EpmB